MVSSQYFSALTKEEKDEYILKLTSLGFSNEEDDPFILDESLSKEIWSFPVESWPEVEFGNVYVYLLELSGCGAKSLKAYKSLDAYKCFANGFVHHLAIRQNLTGHSIIRARVKRSENATEEPHRTWVGLDNEDGSIITGHCTCMTESSVLCTHVSALVFQIEAASRQGYKENACTCCSPLPSDGNDTHEVVKVVIPENQSVSEQTEHGSQSESTITVVANKDDFANIGVDLQVMHYCEMCHLGFTDSHLLENHMERDHKADPLTVKEESEAAVGQEESFSEDVTAMESSLQGLKDHDGLLCSTSSNAVLPPNLPSKNGLEIHYKVEDMNVSKQSVKRYSISKQKICTVVQEASLNNMPHKCTHCGRLFKRITQLRLHMKTHARKISSKSNENRKPLNLTDCEESCKIFTSAKNLPRESSVTCNEKQVNQCEECGRNLSCAASLRRHMMIHSKPLKHYEKPYKCEECGKSFTRRHDVYRHAKIHGKEGSHDASTPVNKCETCGQIFPFRSNLNRHTMTCAKKSSMKVSSASEVCGKVFETPSKARLHLVMRTKEKQFQCNMCERGYKRQSDLTKHVAANHTNEKQYKCEECEESFKLISDWKCHKRQHSSVDPGRFECGQCGKGFGLLSRLKRHIVMSSHVEEMLYQCGQCKDRFVTKDNLKSHFSTKHAGKKGYVCGVCGENFKLKAGLKRHAKVHKRKCQCDKCDKKCATEHHLQKHMRRHENRVFQCQDCGKRFSVRHHLKYHQEIHSKDRLYMCHECGKSFKRLLYLKAHVRRHAGQKPHTCAECGKTFVSPCNLKRHRLIHTGERPFVCSQCGLAFRQNVHLKWHIKIMHSEGASGNGRSRRNRSNLMVMHLGKRHFQCVKCSEMFKSYMGLRNHLKRHSGEKPFVCETCGMAFVWKTNMLRHMQVHTGEKPFSCQVCGRSFGQNAHLQRHMITHTGERPFRCSVCGRGFTEKRGLIRHKTKHASETSGESRLAFTVLEPVEKIL